MPKVGGHKDGSGGVVLHWLAQKGLLRTCAKALFVVVDRGIEPLCQD